MATPLLMLVVFPSHKQSYAPSEWQLWLSWKLAAVAFRAEASAASHVLLSCVCGVVVVFFTQKLKIVIEFHYTNTVLTMSERAAQDWLPAEELKWNIAHQGIFPLLFFLFFFFVMVCFVMQTCIRLNVDTNLNAGNWTAKLMCYVASLNTAIWIPLQHWLSPYEKMHDCDTLRHGITFMGITNQCHSSVVNHLFFLSYV